MLGNNDHFFNNDVLLLLYKMAYLLVLPPITFFESFQMVHEPFITTTTG